MSYEVTATRRRPQNFESLIGQEFVAETLRNTIKSNKIAHAYLFTGPRGCGKTSTARILAKALNCKNGPTATPCGECEACREITAGSCFDVIEIDGASNTTVNDVRQIKDEIQYPPSSLRYKIYIIDEVHMLSNSAFNALLKTIEEPPAYCIFIFATTELQKVPATIKSRCQQFNFRLVPIEKVKEQLALAAQELGIKAQDEALYWIAREATGSMRDSYTLFDQVAAFSGDEITYEKIRDKLGLVGVDRLNELFGLCVAGKPNEAILKLDEYLQNGVSIEQLIVNCTEYLRSLLLIKAGIRKEALLGQNPERYNTSILDAWNSIQIERALSIFMQLYRDIRYSLSPRYELELSISRLCWLKDYVSSSDVKKAIDNAKSALVDNAGPRKIQIESSMADALEDKKKTEPVKQTISEEKKEIPLQNIQKEEVKSSGNIAEQISGLSIFNQNESVADNEEDDSENEEEDFMSAESYEPTEDLNPGAPDTSSFESYAEEYEAEMEKLKPQPAQVNYEPVDVSKINLNNLDEVKSVLVRDLEQHNEVILASNISSTFNWVKNGSSIRCQTFNNYEHAQLQNNLGQICSYLSGYFKESVSFSVELLERKEEKKVIEYPQPVELVKAAFRGTVLLN